MDRYDALARTRSHIRFRTRSCIRFRSSFRPSLFARTPAIAGFASPVDRQHDLAEAAAHDILQRFPAAVVVHARPRGHGPAVVHLPIQRAHAVRLVSAVRLDGGLDRFGLKHLAHV
ncbi:hypothetical protein D1872_270850 [compost metagenome]